MLFNDFSFFTTGIVNSKFSRCGNICFTLASDFASSCAWMVNLLNLSGAESPSLIIVALADSINIKKDTSILNNHLTGFFKYGIEDISSERIEKLKLEKAQKLAPKTVNNVLIVLSAILNFGVRIG